MFPFRFVPQQRGCPIPGPTGGFGWGSSPSTGAVFARGMMLTAGHHSYPRLGRSFYTSPGAGQAAPAAGRLLQATALLSSVLEPQKSPRLLRREASPHHRGIRLSKADATAQR